MPATVSARILEDGPRNAVLLVQGDNGGSGGGDLAYQQLILPSALGYIDQARNQRAAQLRVDSIEWDIQAEVQMQVLLYWDATTPQQFYDCIGRANKYFRDFGGLYVPSGLAGATGGIGIATKGASTTVDNGYTLLLRLVKQ
ncbi:hypothetical protein [Burkholderia cenocepacia]|uniref:hypothetical protein n=1 Tax=Burkholderia cenocepacia TaxID=95486 RepID=UPI001BA376C0|nr:hypothetical protein [Burkholderia cenocepacia]MBR7969102.1 hypothetical protein [Burkholderia cenocepacia]